MFLLVVSFIVFIELSYSQNNAKVTYAIISIESNYDKANKRYWCNINAESIGKYSKEITNLVKYSTGKGAINTGASFYFERNDTTSAYFNYFLSTIEIMQFLADNQWQLITINNEITSNYEDIKEGDEHIPVTKIFSKPVYYFKKEVL